MKEIWSNNYGKNKAEGLHKYLTKNIKDYKRSNLHKYIKGFALHIGKPQKKDSIELASGNFSKWIAYVKQIN